MAHAELDVLPAVRFGGGAAQQVGRVIGGKHREPQRVGVQLTTEAPERLVAAEQMIRGMAAKRNDELGLNRLQLTFKERSAGILFGRQRIAVARRATLQDIADEDLVASQTHARRDDLAEQLSGRANEGSTTLIFVRARSLADKNDARLRVPLAGHGLLAGLAQATRLAGSDLLGERAQGVGAGILGCGLGRVGGSRRGPGQGRRHDHDTQLEQLLMEPLRGSRAAQRVVLPRRAHDAIMEEASLRLKPGLAGVAFFLPSAYHLQARNGMARRKRELLDLLRERAKQKDASRSAESAQPSAPKKVSAPRPAAPAPSQPKVSQARRSASTARPSAPAKSAAAGGWFAEHRTPVLATIALLVIVGALKFWPGSIDPAEASGNGDHPAAAESNEPFAVLVATYAYAPDKVKIAQTTGRELRDLFSDLPDPKLILYPQSDPELIELWIGEAPEATELQDLLRRVQESTVPTDPNNKRPFASARIERRRSISAN